jgi:hypothetical protein
MPPRKVRPPSTPPAPKPSRTQQPSEERRAQQRMLERTATKESWVARLLRAARGATGRPRPGNR